MSGLLAQLQASRAALVEALATGTKRVAFHSGGTRREVEYPDPADIQNALDRLDREIAATEGRKLHTFRPYFNKGL